MRGGVLKSALRPPDPDGDRGSADRDRPGQNGFYVLTLLRTDDGRAISEQRFTSRRPLGVVSHEEREAVRVQLRLMIDI